MSMRVLYALLVFLAFVPLAWANTGVLAGKASVYDGDTVRIGDTRIRIWGIDAVELKQRCDEAPCGVMAREAMKRIIADSAITCTPRGKSYNRIVAQCTAQDRDIAAEMVAAGMAFDAPKYSRNFYATQEQTAKAQRAGLWAYQNVTPPAVWRKMRR